VRFQKFVQNSSGAAIKMGVAAKRKSWQEKLADSKDLPKVITIDGKLSKRWGEGTCVIPAPIEVDEIMRAVPKGKLTTIDDIRKALATKHRATIACPITTGIFAWIAAHAAQELAAEGKTRITPYWRTLKSGGEINPKYPGGVDGMAKLLRAEGHAVVQKGKRFFVADAGRKIPALAS
jgi:alkylated DNA nucleotide flippase Atl1